MKARRHVATDTIEVANPLRSGLPPRNGQVRPTAPVTETTASPDAQITTLGYLAPLSLLAAAALGAIAFADAASREGKTWGLTAFWIAIAVCAAPFAYRLTTSAASRVERLGLTVVFGSFLYLVKILRDPTRFTFADELPHSYNVNSIVSNHALFGTNPILPVTPSYPGLEMTTAALRLVGGPSTFLAGVTVIAIARLVMMIALFLLFERISKSGRIAGLATLVYAANPNFVFFSAQFSYESLALPLAVFAVYAVVRWMEIQEAGDTVSPDPRRLARGSAWAAVAIITTSAVVATHHGASYALIILILAIGRAQREIRRLSRTYVSPFPFAAFALVATLAWLLIMSRQTWHYLTPVVSDAFQSALDIFGGKQTARQLFSGGVDKTPLWGRMVAFGAAGLTVAGLPFGLKRLWKDYRSNPVCLVLGALGALYVCSLGLRLVPSAWEIANRASEYLFLGVAFALAIIGLERWRPRRFPWAGRLAVAAAFAVLIEGGIVAGWSSDVTLAQTSTIAADGSTIQAPGFAVAAWAKSVLGPHRRFAADASNSRLLAAYADEFAISGTNPDVRSVIREPKLEGWHVRLLRRYGLRFVLVDRRRISEDELAGYFFATDATPSFWRDTFGGRAIHKFDRQPLVSRILDSGNIVIYDVGKVLAHHAS